MVCLFGLKTIGNAWKREQPTAIHTPGNGTKYHGLRETRVSFIGQKQANVVFGLGPVDAHEDRNWDLGRAAWLFLGVWVHSLIWFEMRAASHGETLIRSRSRKERRGLV
jgi:hypothetical protein